MRSDPPRPALLVLNQMAGLITWQLVEDIAARGWRVLLLTGYPDTLNKGSAEVEVRPAATQSKGNLAARVLSWVTYCLQAALFIWRHPKEVPLLLFSTPPVLPWLGLLFHLLRGQRYAVMVHDIYPDVLVRLGRSSDGSLMTRVWRALNRQAYERADLVMTIGEAMAAVLRAGFDERCTAHGHLEVITPWADTAVIRPLAKAENWFAQQHGQLGKLTMMYSGNMGFSHEVDTMLAAAERLQEDESIHFVFIGLGPQWRVVNERVKSQALRNVTVLPWQPEEVLPFSLTAADIAFVSLREELTGTMFPSKAFSFMAAGVPLLVSSAAEGELPELVTRFGLGWRVSPGDTEAVCAILRFVREGEQIERFGSASRRAPEEIGSRSNSRATAELLIRILRKRGASPELL